VELGLLALTPVLAAGAVVVSVLTRSTRPVRSVALVSAYAALDLVTVGRVLGLRRSDAEQSSQLQERWQSLVVSVLRQGVGAVRRILGVTIHVEDGSTPADEPGRHQGVIVLARHCGPGDTLFVAWLLAVHYRMRLRVVLKSLLRVIPSIDLGGDVLPFCFIGRRRGRSRRAVADLAGSLHRGDALLLFPEGANFSHSRWRDAVHRLRRSEEQWRWQRLARNRHTLPPRTGGAVAALDAAPGAAVMLLAHSGLGEGGMSRPWWRLPVGQPFMVRTVLFQPGEVPRGDAAATIRWLDSAWTQVDTWVEGNAALAAETGARPGPAAPPAA
jgi:1-acyl-sn-glycerol-3-phosphate acyltransferase